MEYKTVEHIIKKYFEGETSLEEERSLKAFFQSEKVPEHLRMYQEQFSFFASSKAEILGTNTAFEEKLETAIKDQNRTTKARKLYPKDGLSQLKTWSLRVAASILFFAGGWYLGDYYSGNGTEQDKASTNFKIDNVQKEMQDIKQMLVLSMLKQNSASERIKGVSFADDMKQADTEVLEALIRTLNTDENSNVRLAAANALFTFKDSKKVRQALIASLQSQEDPAVQIALINMLIILKEDKAKSSIENFLENQERMPEPVKAKIRHELKKL